LFAQPDLQQRPVDPQRDLDALLDAQRTSKTWLPLARGITIIENTPPWLLDVPGGESPIHVIGVTGPPGAGKSTLTGRLIQSFSARGARVAVVAIDPSSPISGGAVLGDRVRMENALMDRPDVFVRSLASRGSVGAVASATRNVVRLIEATGRFDVVIIETVGAGQTEVAVAGLADSVALVTVPGLGDAVQAIKAGLMEVADLVVVNMADRPGVHETTRHLRLTLSRDVLIKQTTATTGEGVDELRDALDARWQGLLDDGSLQDKRAAKRLTEATLVASEWIRACGARGTVTDQGNLKVAVKQLLQEAATKWQE
jgi:LAO/AO transport system kinase